MNLSNIQGFNMTLILYLGNENGWCDNAKRVWVRKKVKYQNLVQNFRYIQILFS